MNMKVYCEVGVTKVYMELGVSMVNCELRARRVFLVILA